MSVPTIHELDIEGLEPGKIHRLALALVENGMGESVRIPVMVAKGRKPGPVAGITAAVHGNEVNGIRTIHRVFRDFDVDRLRGTVVAVPVVNVMGFLLHQRRTDDGADLNHLFPGAPTGREALVYAGRFFDGVVRQFDLLLDLHTASFGRVNCLYVRADMRDERVARMAYLQRPQIVVHNPPADGTLRGAAEDAGICAITVEIGNPGRFQRDIVKRAAVGLRAVLADWKIMPKRAVKLGKPPIICESSQWTYTDRGGLLDVRTSLAEHIGEGEVYATIRDVFGQETASYRAPFDAVVIGHSVDPVGATGARIAHLGRIASDSTEFVPQDLIN